MSAIASASAAACTPQTKLLMSFRRAPLPGGAEVQHAAAAHRGERRPCPFERGGRAADEKQKLARGGVRACCR